MRDPERIEPIIEAIRKVWKKYPDLRLFQLIGNLTTEDPYYIEDNAFLVLLKGHYPQAFTVSGREEDP